MAAFHPASFAVLAASAAMGCGGAFAADVAVERGSLAVPDRVVVVVTERTGPGGAALSEPRTVDRLGAIFYEDEGRTNRVLIVPTRGAGAVSAVAVATDEAGDVVGVGAVEVERAPGVVEADLVLRPPTCGDGFVTGVEVCDGADLRGADCVTAGAGAFQGGALACAAGCTGYDVAGCWPPSPPRLRLPLNDAHVGSVHVPGSLRPRFEWEPGPAGASSPGLTYDLQYGADPTFPSATTVSVPAVAATSYQPPAELAVSTTRPVGARYWWRVRACLPGGCSDWSGPRYVNVGRCPKDLDGDGYADVVVGARNWSGTVGRVLVYLGGAAPDTLADLQIAGCGGGDYAGVLAFAGDLNADGFSDLSVGAPGDTGVPGWVCVYFGAAVLDASAEALLTDGETDGYFGNSTGLTAADLDADGHTDLAIGSPNDDSACNDCGAVYVFRGAPGAAFDPTPDLVVYGDGTQPGKLGTATAAGDFDGDGFADLAAAAPEYGGTAGRVHVLRGGPTLDAVVDGVLDGDPGTRFGWFLDTADFNADGFADLAASGAYTGTGSATWIHLGGSSGLETMRAGTLPGEDARLASAGDVDGDGFGDVVLGIWYDGGNTGRAVLYRGGAGATFDPFPDLTLFGNEGGELFGIAVAGAADVNGDGYDELIVGADLSDVSGASTDDGRAYLYLGAPTMPAAVPDVTYAEGTPGEFFGFSVD